MIETNKMKTLTPGHKYELENFEAKDQPGQIIQFIEKTPISEGSKDVRTVNDGTTNEEVLGVLIDRMNWLEKRTRERMARGVEGKHVK